MLTYQMRGSIGSMIGVVFIGCGLWAGIDALIDPRGAGRAVLDYPVRPPAAKPWPPPSLFDYWSAPSLYEAGSSLAEKQASRYIGWVNWFTDTGDTLYLNRALTVFVHGQWHDGECGLLGKCELPDEPAEFFRQYEESTRATPQAA